MSGKTRIFRFYLASFNSSFDINYRTAELSVAKII